MKFQFDDSVGKISLFKIAITPRDDDWDKFYLAHSIRRRLF
jgi:hypothetical protein